MSHDEEHFVGHKVQIVNGQNGTVKGKVHLEADEEHTPPDGGSKAWLVMIGSFLCNGILLGVINTYSVLYTEIHENLSERNVTEASSKAALVGSLAMGTTFMVSPVAGVLTDAIGIRRTAFLGGAISSTGMLLSSFFPFNVYALYLTYGIMYGVGSALAYTPSLAILGHYFKRYIGVVNGIVTSGSAVFTILLPHLIDWFLRHTGIAWTLRFIALMASAIMMASLLFKPVQKRSTKKAVSLKSVINISIFSNRRYLIWAVVIPLSLFGYFVPYVHMLKFVADNFESGKDGKWPVICIGITSGIGRLVFGYISDLPKVNRIFLQQISFVVIGGVTTLLPSTSGSFSLLIFMTLLMGLFDGCFISLLGPIAFDLCGQKGAAQAIGMLLGMCSIPLTLGPYYAGILYDHTGTYDLAFRLAGLPPILGALALFLIRMVPAEQPDNEPSMEPLKKVERNGNHIPNGVEARLASTETLGHEDEDNLPV